MKCTHCAADQAEARGGNGKCSVCGANAEVISTSPRSTQTYSYLPMGTPAWPTTIPASLIRVNAPATRMVPLTPGKKRHVRAERALPSVLLLGLLLLLPPLVGAGITYGLLRLGGEHARPMPLHTTRALDIVASDTHTTTPVPQLTADQSTPHPTTTAYMLESDPDLNLSFQYPTGWTLNAPDKSDVRTTVTLSSEDQSVQFAIVHYSEKTTRTLRGPDDLNQEVLSALSSNQSVAQVQPTQTLTAQPQIANQVWQQKEGLVTLTSGNVVHVNSLTVRYKQTYYNIQMYTPQDIYQEALTKYLQHMLDSMHFLS
ncbi:hypothetical protein KSC_053840 [Ktedonobacter sp. SOSP1-52]|uniref:hypothetical protein n=1 Tax=Ktedonobacter sp. SOSP1-52 TaxID=2778366 RepID=UPI0019160A70|nr:hypothetical protein [Ktedonobacter sp. SOSP1-52]GHO66492.1 hypothetical protein KSC_053840 [Ktedonobacter sp. SOSP1-52]